MRAVILAGGYGTRLREETEFKPKPMVEVGERPILWHIMKNLSVQGIKDFIICLGYKGDFIKDYFINYESRNHDITVKLGKVKDLIQHTENLSEDWNVTLVNTGLSTMTGGRIYKIRKYLNNERFLCTYGDGLADIKIEELINFHINHGKLATVTSVRPTNRFGALELDTENFVSRFSEKPKLEKRVNGGFFIFESGIFDYLNDDAILEQEPLEKLARDRQLLSYTHEGFWQPMDTFREVQELNSLWQNELAPWKNW